MTLRKLLGAALISATAAISLAQAPQRQAPSKSRQPIVVRDLALWVDSALPAQAMLDTIAQAIAQDPQLAIVQDVRLFDVWREKTQVDDSAKEKSLAFRFWLQDTEATLDEARVADCLARLKDKLVQAHGARQRA